MFSYLTRNCICPYVAQGIIMDKSVLVAKMVTVAYQRRTRAQTEQGLNNSRILFKHTMTLLLNAAKDNVQNILRMDYTI